MLPKIVSKISNYRNKMFFRKKKKKNREGRRDPDYCVEGCCC